MNLLEYSVFSPSGRVDRQSRSLVFDETVHCPRTGRNVPRKLTISFSGEYGRPTSQDDLVHLAITGISKRQGLRSRKVHFTRYEILQMLGWGENGQNYRRVDDAFNRIGGTFLVWNNAWWDKAGKSWVDRKFHLIDDAEIYDREKYDAVRSRDGRAPSWFQWNDVVFESMQAGYIKTVNLDVVLSIKHDGGRRLYRWLDKHFYRKSKVSTSLRELAVQKLGYRDARLSWLRRMIEPAIEELVEKGYIANAYMQIEKKDAMVVFDRPRKQSATTPGRCSQKNLFESRGVSESAARRLLSTYTKERVIAGLKAMDSKRAKGETIFSADKFLEAVLKELQRCNDCSTQSAARPERKIFRAGEN